MQNIRQTYKRKVLQKIATGLISGLLVVEVMFIPYEPIPTLEHQGQIKYGGIWWDIEDYDEMIVERERCLEIEQAEDAAIAELIRQAQERQSIESESKYIKNKEWDVAETYMLANIAMAEAEGEDTKGKALVILVVLNRVQSDEFPDTIEEVIKESNQFTAYENGRYDKVKPNEDCYKALDLVRQNWDESQGATYFEQTSTQNTWHNTNLKKLFTHGNHTFYTKIGG